MPHVILLHGLHMHAWAMKPFAALLKEQGFTVDTFGYYSVWQTLPQHAAALNRFVETGRYGGGPLHFVGHSLGGLVLRHFAAAHPDKVSGRIVTLGTPHCGSMAAERVRSMGLGTSLLGGSYRYALDGAAPPLPPGIELGSIAGSKPQGLGRMLGLHGSQDGTVLVGETRCPGMGGHIVLPVSHSGMIFSRTVAEQTAHFLRRGRFLQP